MFELAGSAPLKSSLPSWTVQQEYRVKITSAAERDLLNHQAFIAWDKPKAAASWVQKARAKMASLSQLPFRCEVIPEAPELGVTYRHLPFKNFRIIFDIAGNEVVILRIIRAQRELRSSMLLP